MGNKVLAAKPDSDWFKLARGDYKSKSIFVINSSLTLLPYLLVALGYLQTITTYCEAQRLPDPLILIRDVINCDNRNISSPVLASLLNIDYRDSHSSKYLVDVVSNAESLASLVKLPEECFLGLKMREE